MIINYRRFKYFNANLDLIISDMAADTTGHRPTDHLRTTMLLESAIDIAKDFLDEDGFFDTGDVATIDEMGFMQITDRSKDVIKSGGEWISSIELENVAVGHPDIAEAAVIGRADEISGEAIAAFVTLIGGYEGNEELISTLRQHVSDKIGPIAKPKSIVITNDLPKTRSGKIMRRLLKDISEERKLGDVTTLANADIVSELQTRSSESSDE